MSDEVNLAELDEQHVELLPSRTVLSMFIGQGTDGGAAGSGTDGSGTSGMKVFGIELPPGGGNGFGSPGTSADG